MDRETAITILVEHSKHPRHKGRLTDAHVSMPGGNPGCGDVITMHVKAEPDEPRIAAATFEGKGCTISQAAASILLGIVNKDRMSFERALEFSYEDMLSLLGRDVVGSRYTCATLALGTLKMAVKTIEMDRLLRASGHSDEDIRRLRETLGTTGDWEKP
jgi:nitrogen fixation NifU-like protein